MTNLVILIGFLYFSLYPLYQFFTQQPVSLWKPKWLLYSHLKMASHFQKNTQILRCSFRPHVIQYSSSSHRLTHTHTHSQSFFLSSDSLAHSLLTILVSLLFLEHAKNTPIQGIVPLFGAIFHLESFMAHFHFLHLSSQKNLIKDTFSKFSFTLCTKPLLLGFVFPQKIYYTWN